MSHKSLTQKFLRGLAQYDLTEGDLKNGGWKYCGGRSGRHLRYFKRCCPDDDLPPHTDHCICGNRIQENCYITNGEEILISGNCCIKKFITKSGRTCERCGEPHKNRKDNLCKDCRKKEKEEFRVKQYKIDNKRIYFNVPYKDKGKAKKLGAKWDGDRKCWWWLNKDYLKHKDQINYRWKQNKDKTREWDEEEGHWL